MANRDGKQRETEQAELTGPSLLGGDHPRDDGAIDGAIDAGRGR